MMSMFLNEATKLRAETIIKGLEKEICMVFSVQPRKTP